MSEVFRLLAPTLFGLEGLAADELRYAGFQNVVAENGRVFFDADFDGIARANMLLRCAERVELVMGSFSALSFDDLYEGAKAIPWERFIGEKDQFPVTGWSLNSQLHSVPDCQRIIKKAVVDHLSGCYGIAHFEETHSLVQIRFSIMKDEVTLMLDTSGEGLHKRGYRKNANAAPIRETLAAAIASLARVRSDSLVVDPMCGSGTLLIESALKACHIAPGLMRHFLFETWEAFPKDSFPRVREELLSDVRRQTDFRGLGFDIDPEAIRLSEENASLARVKSKLAFQTADIRAFRQDELPREGHRKTLILCNPPYGERLLDEKQARQLYKAMGVVLEEKHDTTLAIISPDESFESYFGRKAKKRRKLYNGMLKCQLYLYYE